MRLRSSLDMHSAPAYNDPAGDTPCQPRRNQQVNALTLWTCTIPPRNIQRGEPPDSQLPGFFAIP